MNRVYFKNHDINVNGLPFKYIQKYIIIQLSEYLLDWFDSHEYEQHSFT